MSKFIKIVMLKSSLGFSPYFLLLGAIGCISTLSNLILLQFPSLRCCIVQVRQILERVSDAHDSGIYSLVLGISWVSFKLLFNLHVLAHYWFCSMDISQSLKKHCHSTHPINRAHPGQRVKIGLKRIWIRDLKFHPFGNSRCKCFGPWLYILD